MQRVRFPYLLLALVCPLRLSPSCGCSQHGRSPCISSVLSGTHGSTIDMFVKVDRYSTSIRQRCAESYTPRILLLCCAVARRHALSLRCFRCRSLCGCGMCHHACTRAGGQGCLHHRRTPCRIRQRNVPRPNRGTNVGCVVVSVPTPFSCAVCWFVGFMAVLSAMARRSAGLCRAGCVQCGVSLKFA